MRTNGLAGLSLRDVGSLRSGENRTTCPNCSEYRKQSNVKCFSVNGTTGAFHCFHCEFSGILDEMKDNHKPDNQAPEKHDKPKVQTISKPRDVNPKVSADDLRNSIALTPAAITYMAERGISEKTLRTMRVHSARKWGEEAIVFPALSRDGKTPIHFKYRNFGERTNKSRKFATSLNPDFVFFGLNTLDEKPDHIIICEGEIDMYSLIEAGFRNVLSVPNGAGKGKIDRCLEDAAKEITAATTVTLAMDADEEGDTMKAEMARRIGYRKCKEITYPEGCKDSNDILKAHGAAALMDAVHAARPITHPGIFDSLSVIDSLKSRIGTPIEAGERSPSFPILSSMFRIAPRALTLVVGAKGSGKSSFVRSLILSIIGSRDDYPVAFFASEDSKDVADFFDFFLRLSTGKRANFCTEQEIEFVMNLLAGKLYLFKHRGGFDELMALADFAIVAHGVKCIVIDPWTEIETREEYNVAAGRKFHIDSLIDRLSEFSETRDVGLLALAHPTKSEGKAAEKGAILTAYDVSGTAGWANKSDLVGTISRRADGTTAFYVTKAKSDRYGREAAVLFDYDTVNGRYTELEEISYSPWEGQ